MKNFLPVLALVAFLSYSKAFADGGYDYDLQINSVRFIAQGPSPVLTVFLTGGKVYEYNCVQGTNSVELGKALLSIFLSAYTSGRNVNIRYTGSSAASTNGTPTSMDAATIR
jgi:hypothetical protein